jgi:diguanylate cyclase (GGDEF)-like protein
MKELKSLLQQIELLESAEPVAASQLAEQLFTRAQSGGMVDYQAQALRHLAICAASISQLEAAETYARDAITLSAEHSLQQNFLLSVNALAGIMLMQAKHREALELLEKYLQQASQPGFIFEQARFLNNLGVAHERMGNYPGALKYYLQSVELKRKLSEPRGLAYSLHNIAHIYLWLEMYPESLSHDQEALELLEDIDELRGQASVLNGMGEVAFLQGDQKKAEAFHDRAISRARKSGDYRELAESLLQRVKCSVFLCSDALAQTMLDEAMQRCLTSNDRHMQSEIMLQSAQLDMLQGKHQQALEALFEVMELAQQTQSNDQLCQAYRLAAEVAQKSARFEDAYQYLSHYTELNEQIKGVKVSQQIQAITISFELKAAQAESELLRLRNQELETLSHVDHLTGLANRRFLQQEMNRHWQQSELALLILDIDYFKLINDRYSHTVGDQVLQILGEILQNCCPERCLAARFGGEEFVFSLPGYKLAQAVYLADTVRKKVQQFNWQLIEAELAVTVSVGAAHSTEEKTVEALLELADSRLYRAKRSGRNRVVPGALEMDFF